ncbi:hypothetical protein F5Y16DRAFT_420277 [Xylariaceae sp. FL0255]|nr:hypothetical protein F5Y16DRAFT_420277 [Xylariaceae sp. FL0255]
MFTEPELETAAQKLAEFRQTQHDLAEMLSHYAFLIEEHKQLRSAYDKLNQKHERIDSQHAFVLVLVDGDGYPFNEPFLKTTGSNGGSHAIQKLNEEVLKSLCKKNLDDCQIMIHVYANVQKLSIILSNRGLIGTESQSFASFIGDFNGSYEFTDFVDAGSKKREQTSSCARCSSDMPRTHTFRGKGDKVTLIKSPGSYFHEKFHSLGLGIEELSGVFLSVPVDQMQRDSKIQSGSITATTVPLQDVSELKTSLIDYRAAILAPVSDLPKAHEIHENCIAVNKYGQRLDPLVSVPPNALGAKLHWLESRFNNHKKYFCLDYHLKGSCPYLDCVYSHESVPQELIPVLWFQARSVACKQDACDRPECFFGHLCQDPECKVVEIRDKTDN